MKKAYLHILLLIGCAAVFHGCSTGIEEKPIPEEKSNIPSEMSDTLHIATYNIRIISASDVGDKSWSSRKQYVGQTINDYSFDIFGIQEIATTVQQDDLMGYLPDYSCFSKGRNNVSGTAGERIGIIYRTARFLIKSSGSFFLSETPDVAGKGWDAAHNRIVVWAEMYDKHTTKTFYFFNVHLDNEGVISRREGAKLLATKMWEIAGTMPIFCTGDFNATSRETATYNTMTARYKDSRTVAIAAPTGFVGTYNGFDMAATNFDESKRIDFIFTNKTVISYIAINDKFVSGSYPSDHFPIMIKVDLNN